MTEDGYTDFEFEDKSSSSPEDMGSMKEFMGMFRQFLSMAKKKKKPEEYPYPEKKMSELQKAIGLEGLNVDEFSSRVQTVFKEFNEMKEGERTEKVNELVNMQEEKGMITPENKEAVIKNFASFSSDQLDSMIDSTNKMTPVKTKSFKSKEVGDKKGADEKANAIRSKDFSTAGVDMEGLSEEELNAIKGAK